MIYYIIDKEKIPYQGFVNDNIFPLRSRHKNLIKNNGFIGV